MKKVRMMKRDYHFNLDTDRDGVFDWKDCEPFNSRKQHRGPPEFPLHDLSETYAQVLKNAISQYKSKKDMVRIANAVIKARMSERYQQPRGMWDLRPQPTRTFSSGFRVHPRGNLVHVLDEANGVYFFADITNYLDELRSFKMDGRYMKGYAAEPPKLFLAITALDKELIGPLEIDTLISYAHEHNKLKKAGKR